jgi:hypothetical protein
VALSAVGGRAVEGELRAAQGNDQSAGKRRSGKTGKGDKWLRATLRLVRQLQALGHQVTLTPTNQPQEIPA